MEFTALLSRARRGYQHLTEADKALLRSRLCSNHCNHCIRFKDVMRIRPAGAAAPDAWPTH